MPLIEFFLWFYGPLYGSAQILSIPFLWFIFIAGVVMGVQWGSARKLTIKQSDKLRKQFYQMQADLNATLRTIELKKGSFLGKKNDDK